MSSFSQIHFALFILRAHKQMWIVTAATAAIVLMSSARTWCYKLERICFVQFDYDRWEDLMGKNMFVVVVCSMI